MNNERNQDSQGEYNAIARFVEAAYRRRMTKDTYTNARLSPELVEKVRGKLPSKYEFASSKSAIIEAFPPNIQRYALFYSIYGSSNSQIVNESEANTKIMVGKTLKSMNFVLSSAKQLKIFNNPEIINSDERADIISYLSSKFPDNMIRSDNILRDLIVANMPVKNTYNKGSRNQANGKFKGFLAGGYRKEFQFLFVQGNFIDRDYKPYDSSFVNANIITSDRDTRTITVVFDDQIDAARLLSSLYRSKIGVIPTQGGFIAWANDPNQYNNFHGFVEVPLTKMDKYESFQEYCSYFKKFGWFWFYDRVKVGTPVPCLASFLYTFEVTQKRSKMDKEKNADKTTLKGKVKDIDTSIPEEFYDKIVETFNKTMESIRRDYFPMVKANLPSTLVKKPISITQQELSNINF